MTNDNAMQDALQRLYDSTIAFHDTFQTPRDYEARVRVLCEECGELVRATYPQDIAEEAADVIVTTFGVMQSLGINFCDGYYPSSFLHGVTKVWDLVRYIQEYPRFPNPKRYTGVVYDIIVECAALSNVEAINTVIERNERKTIKTHMLNKHGKVVER